MIIYNLVLKFTNSKKDTINQWHFIIYFYKEDSTEATHCVGSLSRIPSPPYPAPVPNVPRLLHT